VKERVKERVKEKERVNDDVVTWEWYRCKKCEREWNHSYYPDPNQLQGKIYDRIVDNFCPQCGGREWQFYWKCAIEIIPVVEEQKHG
jgi:hypothetical protein